MDRTTGMLYTMDEYDAVVKKFPEAKAIMRTCTPTPKQVKRGKVELDEACPCGSGRKFSKCCFMIVKRNRRIYWQRLIDEALKEGNNG